MDTVRSGKPARGFKLVLLVLLAGCQTGPKKIERVEQVHNGLRSRGVDAIFSESSIPRDQVGFAVMDPVSGEILASQNEKRAFLPASVTKVPTTVAALALLGPEYRFKTTLAHDGAVRGDTLHGNLYLKGTGDPLLTASDLMEFALLLRSKGIRQIKGQFIFDESYFVPREIIDANNDENARYNSGISSLSSEFNQVQARWSLGKDSATVAVQTIPDLPLVRFGLAEEQDPVESSRFAYQSVEGGELWLLPPQLNRSGTRYLPIKRPGLATAQLFSYLCKLNGVVLPEPGSGTLPERATVLRAHQSQSLKDLTAKTLEHSNNMMAELLYAASLRQLPKGSTLESWLATQVTPKGTKTDWAGFRMENGSGLSSVNRMSASQLVSILAFADRKFPELYASLMPISGWKGTLADRHQMPGLAFHVWAKTGTMYYSKALAGFLYTQSGRRLIFAILVSDDEARSKVDAQAGSMKGRLTEGEEPEVAEWTRNAERIHEELLVKWGAEL